jgi:hypothetical protein
MDPEGRAFEEWVDRALRDLDVLADSTVPSPQLAWLTAAFGADARSAGQRVAALGRNLGKTTALSTGEALEKIRAAIEAGQVTYVDGELQMGRFSKRRKSAVEDIPPEAKPIMGYLRVHRDPQKDITTISHRNGEMRVEIDHMTDPRTLVEIVIEDFVPNICSGCGAIAGVPLCATCKNDIVSDLVRELRHE